MRGEVTIVDALDEIEGNVRTRNDGLASLKNILRQNTKVDDLQDAAVHRIYEVLFRVAIEDRSTYLQSTTKTTRNAAEKRLSGCASALRLAIEVTVRLVRLKTLRAVLDHIVHTFPNPDGSPCEPLALDYARSLKALLGYQAHVEHLPQKERKDCAVFCVGLIDKARVGLLNDDATQPGAEPASTAGTNGISYRSSRSHALESNDSQGVRSLTKQVAEEAVGCLALLTAAPNATTGTSTATIVLAVIGFLQTTAFTRRSHQDAFAAINNLLSWSETENITLTKQVLSQLIRLIRMYWSHKASSGLKDEILIVCIHLQPYIVAAMRDDNPSLRSELTSMLEVLRNEYARRQERDLLHVEDLRLDINEQLPPEATSISTKIFSLRSAGSRSEAAWSILHTIAVLCNVLSHEDRAGDASDDEEDEDVGQRPRKRQRITNELDDTLHSSTIGGSTSRMAALQVLTFFGQLKACSRQQLSRIIDRLSVSCADDNVNISSWAFLALASFASQDGSTHTSLSSRWSLVWQHAHRAMSNANTCRSASHLLYVSLRLKLVSTQTIADLVQTLTASMHINGPTILADSVVNLCTHTVQLSHQMNPAGSSATAESILGWLFRNFTPSRFQDRAYTGQQAPFEASGLTALVSLCMGKPSSHLSRDPYPLWGTVASAWLACQARSELVSYLLLLPRLPAPSHEALSIPHGSVLPGPQSKNSCETIVLDNLTSETFRTQESWTQLASRNMSHDMLTSICRACLFFTSIAFCNDFQDRRRITQLQKQAQGLLNSLMDYVRSSACPQDHVDSALVNLSPALRALLSHPLDERPCPCEHLLCQAISDTMEARRDSEILNGPPEVDDLMDVDGNFDSQGSKGASQAADTQDLLNDNSVIFGSLAMRMNITFYALVVSKKTEDASVSDPSQSTSKQVLSRLLSLPSFMVFAGRNVISRLPLLGIDLDAEDAAQLIEFCADQLSLYHFERCEVALGAILDIMASIASVWTDPANDSLYQEALDIYHWYTSVGLPKLALSANVQTRLASLLLQLCHVDTDYGTSDGSGQSVRTSIFKLIKVGSISVQYHLADRIQAIFKLFVLSNHLAMFEDLKNSIPSDTDWVEGMATRLLFLSRLASAWHSLLRECVYYIFETAGVVEAASRFAARNISELADALHFDTPQRLFRLFAPQLLCSWLASHKVTDLPFAIFRYDSLDDLVAQNLSELTAQLHVRDDEEGLQVVTTTMKLSQPDLVRRCFAKCLAYCISHDIVDTSSKDAERENRLRKIFGGKDQVNKLAATHYPAILGQFFLSAQNDDVDDKWLDKKEHYAVEAHALKEMKSYSHSDKSLPECQQPSFRSKFICDQIERLCRRISDISQCWNPSSFALVARLLFDSIDDALGPQHTCLVIRRLRLLVCLAGDVALSDFQLEMLIHTLRPYLSDSQCADDVMGVLQYLFQRGQDYLRSQPRFLYGTVTLMILQVRRHSSVRQESTTQASQHQATVAKMQTFHTWLVDYARQCQPQDKRAAGEYLKLVNALADVQLPGNARQGSSESSLLIILLNQRGKANGFLRPLDRDEALFMLSENFSVPASTEEDCLNTDESCVQLSQQLWQVLQIKGLGSSFVTWVAVALGRAYACTGDRPRREETNFQDLSTEHSGAARSHANIAKRLSTALFLRDKTEASLADYTLRSTLLSFDDPEESTAFENMLPQPVVTAFGQREHDHVSPSVGLNASTAVVPLRRLCEPVPDTSLELWIQSFSVALCQQAKKTAILPALTPALRVNSALALDLFPSIVHIVLAKEIDKKAVLKQDLSSCIAAHFDPGSDAVNSKQRYLLRLLLYLRAQALPNESTPADRLRWLDVDWLQAANVAVSCSMPTTAIFFAESAANASPSGRRTSSRASMSQVSIAQVSQDLLLSIFKEIDEPDSFYGVEQPASLDSVLGRFDYESDGLRSLMFRSANTDSHVLSSNALSQLDTAGMIRSLSLLNLNSLTFALLSGNVPAAGAPNDLLHSARKLQQWDISASEAAPGPASSCFSLYQELSRAQDLGTMRSRLDVLLSKHLAQNPSKTVPSYEWLNALASMVEVGETIGSSSKNLIRSSWERIQSRQDWMQVARFNDIALLLSNRQILFSTLARNKSLLTALKGNLKESRAVEIEALLNVSASARQHDQLQEALSAVSQAGNLTGQCEELGIRVAVAVNAETASVLWESQEPTAAVKMIRNTLDLPDLEQQSIAGVGYPGLLARLGHQLAEARLEKPETILSNYLQPARNHLGDISEGAEAGEVFYEFASFCDRQLQSPSNVQDLERIERLRQKKLDEANELKKILQGKQGHRDDLHDTGRALTRAQRWFEIDDDEYQRLKRERDTHVQQSLENYMLALKATNKHDISVLRLFALWLESSDNKEANAVASKHLPGIPSWKFVLLMNQLMSRLENDNSAFQKALSSLVYRICAEHPHHSLHHLYATSRKPESRDQATDARWKAASHIGTLLSRDPERKTLLENTFKANRLFDALAKEDCSKKSQGRHAIDNLSMGGQLKREIPRMRVPPVTIAVSLRPNGDYRDVPIVAKFSNNFSVMSGNSHPKKLSVLATNGREYSQLFKDGDDLRQDAIMEQVFDEVSKMLRNHTAARQRNLHVRTYKVIPLGPKTGVIEFVPNSTSFAEFLVSAHERYHPQDWKNGKARSTIHGAQNHSTETRIKRFREVCDHLQPVMRHFFFERFNDPDEWFEKRTAYTRTTATISILGYVLGLGDRHCQNVMLDEKTGEVVHIDLGIAFEAGRVLPVPELVPFRLSRDVIDGMGITKTEGVFRRCCEFTMDALREDKDSIMTLLNVLRYDPLYSWNVSPLRAKRMQEQTVQDDGGGSKKRGQEEGEADRALSIVEKKLSKTLSTAATVSELIQQATDERNLATLFGGWSAWF